MSGSHGECASASRVVCKSMSIRLSEHMRTCTVSCAEEGRFCLDCQYPIKVSSKGPQQNPTQLPSPRHSLHKFSWRTFSSTNSQSHRCLSEVQRLLHLKVTDCWLQGAGSTNSSCKEHCRTSQDIELWPPLHADEAWRPFASRPTHHCPRKRGSVLHRGPTLHFLRTCTTPRSTTEHPKKCRVAPTSRNSDFIRNHSTPPVTSR